MNPFEAPRHDSPPPAGPTLKRRLLGAVGIVEMLGGVLLSLLSLYVGVTQSYEARAQAGGVETAAMVFAVLLFVTAGVFCVVAGYKLTRGSSKRALLLQLVPVLVSAFFVWISMRR